MRSYEKPFAERMIFSAKDIVAASSEKPEETKAPGLQIGGEGDGGGEIDFGAFGG